jgi:hypothetical protein
LGAGRIELFTDDSRISKKIRNKNKQTEAEQTRPNFHCIQPLVRQFPWFSPVLATKRITQSPRAARLWHDRLRRFNHGPSFACKAHPLGHLPRPMGARGAAFALRFAPPAPALAWVTQHPFLIIAQKGATKTKTKTKRPRPIRR